MEVFIERREAQHNRESRRDRREARTNTGLRELGMKGRALILTLADPGPVGRADVRMTRGEGRNWEEPPLEPPGPLLYKH